MEDISRARREYSALVAAERAEKSLVWALWVCVCTDESIIVLSLSLVIEPLTSPARRN